MADTTKTQESIDDQVFAADASSDVAKLQQDLTEANEKFLRGQAELENYRKRVRREMEEERRYALLPFAKDLLTVVDNLERAIASGQEGQGLLEGVKMVSTQLQNVLNQHQCVRIETVGQPFDPNVHQAIAQEASSEHPAGTVTREAQSGYKLFDRVIRPAQVFVSTGAPVG
ncbi:MAG: nucleotide exchange factor GrpE [Planctomycetales bacterium]|nr:nucleotide exchange factor GrpE [Planctomycetales bacterium]